MNIKKCITGRGEIREQIKFRNYFLIFFVILGIIYFILRVLNIGIGAVEGEASYIYSGIAGAYILVGILSVIKNIRLLKNDELLKKYAVEVKDERNVLMQRRALSISVYIYVWAGFIAGLVIAPVNYGASCAVFYSICALLIIYSVTRYILNRIM